MGTAETREQEHFFGAAKMVAGLTLLSRVLGLVRDMVLVPLGGPAAADAFWIGFSVPHYFRRLFGEGALSAAFIPVFTAAGERDGWDHARKVLANTAGWLAVVLGGLIVLIELGLLGALLAWPGPWHRQLAIELTMVMLPFMFFICQLALASAALNSRGHFAYPAAAPILLNVGLIVVGGLVAPALGRSDTEQFYIVGVGVVLCGIGQFAGALALLRRTGLAGAWRLRPVLPEIRAILLRMAPTIIPLSMMQISDLGARLLAKALTATQAHPDLPLAAGVVRCHYTAGRLYQFPMGVLGVSIATVVFPLLSRYAGRNDVPSLRDVIHRALRLCLFLGIPAGVGIILIAQPAVGVIFQRKGFVAADTWRTARMLQMYCLGMPAYFAVHILLRAFFARNDTRTPMVASAALAIANVLLVLGGIFTPLRSSSLGLATALTSTANALILAWVLRRRLGRLGLRGLALSTARVATATAAMAAAVLASQWMLRPLQLGRLAGLGAAVAVGAAVFLLAAWALRCPELADLVRRKRKSPPDSGTMK